MNKNICHIPKGDITTISQKQLSLADIFEDCKDIFESDKNGIPCCPHDSSLPMKQEGSKSHLKSKLPTMKFVCPKMKLEYNRQDKSKRRVCHCDNPCTTSSCGRMIYVYPEKNLRAYLGVERGSKEWDETCFCIAKRKTTNEKTLYSDLLLADISQLFTVVADKINQRQHIRSLKSLIA